jgi:hypothetical protein
MRVFKIHTHGHNASQASLYDLSEFFLAAHKKKKGRVSSPLELLLVEVVLKIEDLLEFKGVLFHYLQDGSALRAGYTPPKNCLRLTQTELCPTNRTSRPGHVGPHLEGFPGWLGWPGCLGFFSLSSIMTTPF